MWYMGGAEFWKSILDLLKDFCELTSNLRYSIPLFKWAHPNKHTPWYFNGNLYILSYRRKYIAKGCT
jgi:hypothetical protein